MSTAARTRFTPEQYLASERNAETKSEYFNGSIYAMSGATREHCVITMNLGIEIGTQLKGRPCEAYSNDMRVRIQPTGLYTYPDLAVVCGEPIFEDEEFDTLLNPTALAEVLSPSTEAYDRGAKFGHYRKVESLRQFLLVSQDRVLVERYTRDGEDWIFNAYSRLDDVLRLESIGCAVTLRDIYAKLSMPDEANP